MVWYKNFYLKFWYFFFFHEPWIYNIYNLETYGLELSI